MFGDIIRFNKLFSNEEKVVVVAVDHGEFSGPIPGLIDLPKTVESVKEAEAILMSPGMVAHCLDTFSRRDSPRLILRLNWSSSYCFQWNYNDSLAADVISPQEALYLGADLGMASLILKTEAERVDTENVANFAKIIREKRRCGLPIIGEYYPCNMDKLTPEDLHQQVYIACRIISELGADAIKTFYTGEKFSEIVEATPIPILTLGAEKMEKESQALQLAYKAVNAGAKGVVFGRNVFQAKNPEIFLKALKKVVKEGRDPKIVSEEFDL